MKHPHSRNNARALQCVTRSEFWCFLQELQSFEQEQHLHEYQDAFLDAYSAYLHHGTAKERALVEQCADELRIVDPDFHFKL